MRKEIVNKINEIKEEIKYYKNLKNFNNFIIKLNKKINKNEENVLLIILDNWIKNIENEVNEDNLKEINEILKTYINNNIKKYLNKIEKKNMIIYEYIDEYVIYVLSKDLNFIDECKQIFPEKKISNIYVDNHKWKKIENIKKEDIIFSKKIKVIIKK